MEIFVFLPLGLPTASIVSPSRNSAPTVNGAVSAISHSPKKDRRGSLYLKIVGTKLLALIATLRSLLTSFPAFSKSCLYC
jgi:hypothetical protein